MKTTLLIATYNWPEALKLVLESVFRQTVLPDEIVIADDGSGPETKALIDAMRNRSPIPITHVWHEDDGFRLTVIRNKAVAASKGDYILQIDGDCILPTHYVEDHINMATDGYFSGGRRILLDENMTRETFSKGELYYSALGLLKQHQGLNQIKHSIHSPFLMRFYSRKIAKDRQGKSGVAGFSFSFWKKDFIAVNGYDESFNKWGGEDSDLAHRFLNRGLKALPLRFGGFVFHLHHTTNGFYKNPNDNPNHRILLTHIANGTTYIENGIDKWL